MALLRMRASKGFHRDAARGYDIATRRTDRTIIPNGSQIASSRASPAVEAIRGRPRRSFASSSVLGSGTGSAAPEIGELTIVAHLVPPTVDGPFWSVEGTVLCEGIEVPVKTVTAVVGAAGASKGSRSHRVGLVEIEGRGKFVIEGIPRSAADAGSSAEDGQTRITIHAHSEGSAKAPPRSGETELVLDVRYKRPKISQLSIIASSRSC